MRWLGPFMAAVKPDSAIAVDFVIVRFKQAEGVQAFTLTSQKVKNSRA
jgi:hypothetical protein